MKNFLNLLSIRSLIYLTVVLLITSCKRSDLEPEITSASIEIINNTNESENCKSIETTNNPCNTIVVFLGNPGVGKSTLCNSIFQRSIFESSGLSFVGVTQVTQEYTIDDIKYIDTPGLDDLFRKKEAAQEVEKALKGNNNYKVIFVTTLEGGRIRASDLATINAVCDAIQEADFEYGIIFNKMDKNALNHIKQNRKGFNDILTFLHKIPKPESILFIEQDCDMLCESDKYFSIKSESYTKLAEYINKLKPIKINPNNVGKININNYQGQVEALETELAMIKREQAKKLEEMEKKHCEEISSIKEAMEKQIDSINVAFIQAKEKLEAPLVERETQEKINSIRSAFKEAFDAIIANMEQEPNLNKEQFEENKKKIEEASLELDNKLKNIQKITENKLKRDHRVCKFVQSDSFAQSIGLR